MSTELTVLPRHSRRYQITVEGKIDASWSGWLGGLQLHTWHAADDQPMTTLSGVLPDQVALRGLLLRLWDLNLVLCSLQASDPIEPSLCKKNF